jgi:hypothetical protein
MNADFEFFRRIGKSNVKRRVCKHQDFFSVSRYTSTKKPIFYFLAKEE